MYDKQREYTKFCFAFVYNNEEGKGGELMFDVVRLQINYHTLEQFKRFTENGLEELSMLDELHENMVENQVDSPFYGIYEDGTLVARMSLYPINAKYDRYFDPPRDYLELWKLEVLPGSKGRGLGTQLVTYAKSLGHAIKVNVRGQSHPFFLQLGFTPVKYDAQRDRGENPYVWIPNDER
ncbi:putative N-acetyltransferase YlbP [Acidibacillus sp. S0AB]|uniref:N-acetyltransferase YlbP n=2 Tax=Sulfoacidibacillus ferrooxidans TaxID=2005001 RepID=A0A9X2ACS7_9BACL|nr:putative N-acetyltransferase YlbP [Sulfoacidibacillus ferrooxidans]